jgi:bifunctional enzyme CysN/CysC
MEPQLLRFTTAGSVDDGKSTLIGRLLHDSRSIYQDQLESVRKASRDGLDLAFITDGLRAEREQGITIDVAYRYFSTARRRFIIADTPGHEQYTRNMATGASTSDLALILVDCTKGLLPQTCRHAYISWLFGIRTVVFVVNKMDAVAYREDVFSHIRREIEGFAQKLAGCSLSFIPVSALEGDNVVQRSERMPWYTGKSLLEYLETVSLDHATETPALRLPVQYVIRSQGDFRGYAGQLAAGSVKAGDEVLILPSGYVTRVKAICALDGNLDSATAPMSVTLCLDGQFDVDRGSMLASPSHPPLAAQRIQAILIWMHERPLSVHHPYLVKHTSQKVCGQVSRLMSAFDVKTLEEHTASELRMNEIGSVELETHRPLFFDVYEQNHATGSFVLIDPITNQTMAAGMITGMVEQKAESAAQMTQAGLTLWFTGLSSAGKTTISRAVSERLWAMGYKVELLDGDTVRTHLCKDLGFSEADRNENVRRIGFVADLLARNGIIAIVSAISPYRAVRDEQRSRISSFIEIYVNAPLAVCEKRDVKGLYSKARAGLLSGFTGIDDPYEPPLSPEIECHTDRETLAESVSKVLQYLETHLPAMASGLRRVATESS